MSPVIFAGDFLLSELLHLLLFRGNHSFNTIGWLFAFLFADWHPCFRFATKRNTVICAEKALFKRNFNGFTHRFLSGVFKRAGLQSRAYSFFHPS